jgi:Transcriptional regulatory protein, C terminal
MPEKIHIALIGKDDVLAELMAEQAKTSPDFEFSYSEFSYSEFSDGDDTAAQAADVWLLGAGAKPPTQDDAPLCIRIVDHDVVPASDGLVFTKPIRLAQLLDVALGSAKLRRRKQPRALGAQHMFHPFARLVENTITWQQVVLTEKEAGFLCAILDAGDKGLQRKDAMTQLWGYHPDVESHAVDTALYRLRQKLQEVGDCDTALVNEGGVYFWRE